MPGLNKQFVDEQSVLRLHPREVTGKASFHTESLWRTGGRRALFRRSLRAIPTLNGRFLPMKSPFNRRAAATFSSTTSGHDIAGFHGGRIDFDLYAPLDRVRARSARSCALHSSHANPKDGKPAHCPWIYADEGRGSHEEVLQPCANQLIPYLYTCSWLAHRDSVPHFCAPCTWNTLSSRSHTVTAVSIFFGNERCSWRPVVDGEARIRRSTCRPVNGSTSSMAKP